MDAMIEAIKLNKYYGARHVVKDVSFALSPGGATGFLGRNGAGKSTTMRMLTGFLAPSSGQVKIAAIDVAQDQRAALKQLGYLPESNALYRDMRADEFLDYRAQLKEIPRRRRRAAVARVIEACWLTEVQHRIIGQLSKGYRQRVGLADCLLGDPPLLILDEPTVGLDPNQVRQMRILIRELGAERTVFLSTHILHEVEMICNQVLIINEGAIVGRGSAAELCRDYVGERYLRLQLTAPASAGEVAAAVQALSPKITVLNYESDPRADATCGHCFHLQCGADLRRELSQFAAARGYLVEEMALEPVRLEDIFKRLTTTATA
jgi:ABC-2 type transport system ATP-binding protein